MTGWWLASYIVLWVLLFLLGAFVLGLLREVGLLRQGSEPWQARPEEQVPVGREDGPPLGSLIPDLTLESINGAGTVRTREPGLRTRTMVVFMSALCESCQYTVEPLNETAERLAGSLRVIVPLKGEDFAARAYLSVFPIHAPVVSDRRRAVSEEFSVWGAPYALVYDEAGRLTGKGTVQQGERAFRAVLGETPVAADLEPEIICEVRDKTLEFVPVGRD